MHTTARSLCALAALITPTTLAPSLALADINGFGDFSGFAINKDDAASAPALFPPERIRITSQSASQSRSIFCTTRQGISAFEASFTYQATGATGSANPRHFGAAFVIQNSTNGFNSVARANVGGSFTRFGYRDESGTFQRSLGVTLEQRYLDDASSSLGTYRDGNVSDASNSTSPLNLFGNPINVSISYNGTLLHVTLLDTVTNQSFERFYAWDIPSVVGGPTAYIGFTASTGGNTSTEQFISNFRFTSVPAPSGLGALVGAGIVFARRRRSVA